MTPAFSEKAVRIAAVWGLTAPIVAILVAFPLLRAVGASRWPEPLIDLAAFALTLALTLAPLVGIVAALHLVAERR